LPVHSLEGEDVLLVLLSHFLLHVHFLL
jgi:hypothetical protein